MAWKRKRAQAAEAAAQAAEAAAQAAAANSGSSRGASGRALPPHRSGVRAQLNFDDDEHAHNESYDDEEDGRDDDVIAYSYDHVHSDADNSSNSYGAGAGGGGSGDGDAKGQSSGYYGDGGGYTGDSASGEQYVAAAQRSSGNSYPWAEYDAHGNGLGASGGSSSYAAAARAGDMHGKYGGPADIEGDFSSGSDVVSACLVTYSLTCQSLLAYYLQCHRLNVCHMRLPVHTTLLNASSYCPYLQAARRARAAKLEAASRQLGSRALSPDCGSDPAVYAKVYQAVRCVGRLRHSMLVRAASGLAISDLMIFIISASD